MPFLRCPSARAVVAALAVCLLVPAVPTVAAAPLDADPQAAFLSGDAPAAGGATSESDVLVGTAGDDVLAGLDGDDRLDGLEGADELSGNSGGDVLDGGAGPDELLGGSGDDTVAGGPGHDVVAGGSGQERIDLVDGAVDVVSCGSDADSVRADAIDLVDREDCESVSVVGRFRPGGVVGTLPGGTGEGLLPAGAPDDRRFEAVAGVLAVGAGDPGGVGGARDSGTGGEEAGAAMGDAARSCARRRTVTVGLPPTRGRRVVRVRAQVGGRAVRVVRVGRARVRITLPARSRATRAKLRLVVRVEGRRRAIIRRRPVPGCL